MKKHLLLLLFISGLFLFGCTLKENYSLHYTFSNEPVSQTVFKTTNDGFKLKIPVNDFSCDVDNARAEMERQINTFSIVIEGPETIDRCNHQFSAEVSGIDKGSYDFRVIYNRAGKKKQIFYQGFKIDN